MKIGIYTIHAPNNFGAMLQAYATQKALDKIGVSSELVNLYPINLEKQNKYLSPNNSIKNIIKNIYAITNPKAHLKSRRFADFHNSMKLSRRYYTIDEIYANPPQYDIHLVGSDQVWNLERGLQVPPFFFLPFLSPSAKRISYASSFGNVEAAKKYKDEIISYLSLFDYRSVREQDAAQFLTKECNLPTVCVLDPTFLLSAQQWSEIAGSSPLIKGKYILYYGFDKNQLCREALKFLRTTLCLPLVGVSVSLHSPYTFDKFYQEAGPIEFLNLIKNAAFIVTSSFHGMALSINFRKDFVVLKHGTRMSRMESLLHDFFLEDRLVDNTQKLQDIVTSKLHINYGHVNPHITAAINRSKNWLISIMKNYKQ